MGMSGIYYIFYVSFELKVFFNFNVGNFQHELKKRTEVTSGQDEGVGRYTLPLCTIKRRTTTNFKNKKQPELTENRTVWKSDNQGVKEETFIQTSRRGGDGQLGGEDSGLGSGWRTRVGKAALGGPGEMVNFGRADPCSHTDKPGGTMS